METLSLRVTILSSIWLAIDALIEAIQIAISNHQYYALVFACILTFTLIAILIMIKFYDDHKSQWCLTHFTKFQAVILILTAVMYTETFNEHYQFAFIFYFTNLTLFVNYSRFQFSCTFGLLSIIEIYHSLRIYFFINHNSMIYLIRHLLFFTFLIASVKIKNNYNETNRKLFEVEINQLIQILNKKNIKCIYNSSIKSIYNQLNPNIIDKLVEIKFDRNTDDLPSLKENEVFRIENSDPKRNTISKFIVKSENEKNYSFVQAIKSTNRELTLKEIIKQNSKNKQPCLIKGIIQGYEHEFLIVTTSLNNEKYTFINVSPEYQMDRDIKNIKETVFKQLQKVSHDMRTPLNAIINMLKCLIEFIEPYLYERYLQPALSSCQLLLNLLNDILDMAQLEKNKIRLVYTKFHLENMVSKLIKIFKIQAEKKSIDIETKYDPLIHKNFYTDKQRLKQILINLLSNALKYTKPQGVIRIQFRYINPEIIEVEVSDTGMGIKEEEIANLFQDFYKVTDDQNLQKNPRGVGLGLQISQELAILMGPKNSYGITIKSIFGQGTTFGFRLKNQYAQFEENLEESNPEGLMLYNSSFISTNKAKFFYQNCMTASNRLLTNRPQIILKDLGIEQQKSILSQHKRFQSLISSLSMTEQQQHFQQVRHSSCDIFFQILGTKWQEELNGEPGILIVDDDEFNIVTLQFMLDKLNLNSDSAISGREAIQKVTDRHKKGIQYRIIFLDIEMPEMDGEQTAKELLKLNETLLIVPCSGYDSQQIKEKWKQIGMQDSLGKPIDKRKLKVMLEEIFRPLL